MLKPGTWKPRDGPLSAAHTEVFIAGERSSQGWLPDGRELYNPAELSEPLSEKMSRSQNCKVSQGDTRIWVLTQESQLEDISELRYLTPAATMESRHRTAKQVSESFPAQEKKNGSKKVKGLKPSGNFIPPWSDFWWRQLQEHVPEVLFHSSQELLKRHGWKKPTPWPTVSIQMGNKLDPL